MNDNKRRVGKRFGHYQGNKSEDKFAENRHKYKYKGSNFQIFFVKT